MGILDSKSRIMDVVITQEGKRQLASGKMRAEFISFTDANAFYERDLVNGSTDATDRIYFEVMERIENSITFEADDSGNLFGPRLDNETVLRDGQLFKLYTGSIRQNSEIVTGSVFASSSSLLIGKTLTNYQNNYLLSSRAANDVNTQFTVDKNNIEFVISNIRPFPNGPQSEKANIDSIEPFFLDKRLQHLPNFQFLPPVTKTGESYGNYTNLAQNAPLTFEELIAETSWHGNPDYKNAPELPYQIYSRLEAENLGENQEPEDGLFFTKKEQIVINTVSNSPDKNIVMQMFETTDNKLQKLDVIDFGEFNYEKDINRKTKRVFFVGKVFEDSFDTPTFVNMFTIILD